MIGYSYLHGAVYIFENPTAKRVKVGLTRNTHDIAGRLNDLNDIWLERKVRCQICGTRIVRLGFLIPQHVISGVECPGGNALPFEQDVSLAESHLQAMKMHVQGLTGSQKGSISKIIKTLETRIEFYTNHQPRVGKWKFSVAYITQNADKVEALSHSILADYHDKNAPIGEVFSCSVLVATEAIEKALNKLDLLSLAKKENEM